MTDAILDVRINTLLASSYGVPVVLASGDEAACAEFSALAPRAVTVPVKQGLGQHAADTLHPREACERLRTATGQAIGLQDSVATIPFAPLRLSADKCTTTACSLERSAEAPTANLNAIRTATRLRHIPLRRDLKDRHPCSAKHSSPASPPSRQQP